MATWQNLPTLIQPLLDAAATHANDFLGLGQDFLALALLLSAMELVYEYFFIGGAQQVLSKAFRLFVVTSVPLFALLSWDQFTGALTGFLQHEIPNAIGFNGSGISALSDALNKLSNSLGEVMTAVFKDVATAPSSDHWFPSFDFSQIIYSALAFLMLLIPVVILGFALLVALFYPLMLIAIGVVFGPILIAWLPFKPLSGLSTNWLKFMLSAGMSFGVGLLLVAMGAGMMTTLANQVQTVGVQSTTNLIGSISGLFITAIAILLLAYLMLKAEHIGTALVGGIFAGGGGGLLAGMMLSKMLASRPNSSPRPDASDDGGKSQKGGQKQAGMSADAAKSSSAVKSNEASKVAAGAAFANEYSRTNRTGNKTGHFANEYSRTNRIASTSKQANLSGAASDAGEQK